MKEVFALQKLLRFFRQKYWHIWDINIWNFNETLTNQGISFEQLGPDQLWKKKMCSAKKVFHQEKQTGSHKSCSFL